MVARLALVLAERPNFEACGIAAFGLQNSVGYRRRDQDSAARTGPRGRTTCHPPYTLARYYFLQRQKNKETEQADFRSKVNLLQFDIKPMTVFSVSIIFCSWFQNHIWHFTELTSQSQGPLVLECVRVYPPTN